MWASDRQRFSEGVQQVAFIAHAFRRRSAEDLIRSVDPKTSRRDEDHAKAAVASGGEQQRRRAWLAWFPRRTERHSLRLQENLLQTNTALPEGNNFRVGRVGVCSLRKLYIA